MRVTISVDHIRGPADVFFLGGGLCRRGSSLLSTRVFLLNVNELEQIHAEIELIGIRVCKMCNVRTCVRV